MHHSILTQICGSSFFRRLSLAVHLEQQFRRTDELVLAFEPDLLVRSFDTHIHPCRGFPPTTLDFEDVVACRRINEFEGVFHKLSQHT